MITRIEVDGFKSLSKFNLNLTSGLNILVGPNGSGKTNIVLFFEFLSKLTTNEIGNAVSSVGGAGSIFKKIGADKYDPNISFKIFGSKAIDKKRFISYEYCATITTSFETDNLYYSKQNLKLKSESSLSENIYSNSENVKWDFDLLALVDNEGKLSTQIIEMNSRKIKPRFLMHENGKDIKKNVIELLKHNNPTYRGIIECLFPLLDEFIFAVYSDLIGGETFNVVPTKVKETEDAATPPGLKKDGSGLATTLYAMKKSKGKNTNFPRFYFQHQRPENNYAPETLKRIVGYLKLANNTIVDLDVDNDPFDNKLVVKIKIKTGDYEAVLPLSAMSDGTIKWLALITAILTSKTIFSIEEPENFLHPWMQAEIADIMRTHLQEKKESSFVLMTTHSESLLNHSKPSEIILVDLKDGKTHARRITNLVVVQEEISNSGFGLGHFYFSNSLENE